MKSRKAFTLVELLVAIACSLIVFTALSFSMYFLVRINDTVIINSSLNYKLSEMQDFVRKNVHSVDSEANFSYDKENDNLYYVTTEAEKEKKTLILHNVELIYGDETKFLSQDEDGFCFFSVTYLNASGDEEVYRFILN